MRIVTNSTAETESLGESLAARLKGGEVLALFGLWEWGKRRSPAPCPRLGVQGGVSSPTFALVHEHVRKDSSLSF